MTQKLKPLTMKKIYRIIPIIGYLLEYKNRFMRENLYFILYHLITGTFIALTIIILTLKNH